MPRVALPSWLLGVALAGCTEPEKPAPPEDSAACVPAVEVPYDGVDQDCDGADLVDVDGDGHAATAAGGEDCDDADAAVHPGAADACDGNGVDDDCNGVADEVRTWYADRDLDGYGRSTIHRETCDPPDGYSLASTDCDDEDEAVHPGAPEACNGVDDDCDGVLPADEADADADGFRACDGDCDDADARRGPGLVERCDGVDEDCDGEVDEACVACDRVVPDDHATLQDAVDAAADGETVCVAPGTYTGCVDLGGAEVTLLGVAGPAATVLDGSDNDCTPLVRFGTAEGPGAVLSGFTLSHSFGYRGGCVEVDGASPTLQDLVFEYGGTINAEGRGGGLYVRSGAPHVSNILVRNSESAGGGYDGYGYGYGGAVYLEDSDAVLDGVVLVDNYGAFGGGGLAMVDDRAAILHTRIEGNAASEVGGAGVWIEGGAPTFTNVRIVDNDAERYFYLTPSGGGVYVTGAATPTFTNVLVQGNTADGEAGGILVDDGAPVFVNTIVTGNSGATAAVSGTATFRYSDVWGNRPADFAGTDPTGTDGNLSVDPALLDDAGHVDATSSMIDAGDPALLDPDGSRSDIGPYGGPGAGTWDLDGDGWPAWWLPGSYDVGTSPGGDCDDDDATVHPGAGC